MADKNQKPAVDEKILAVINSVTRQCRGPLRVGVREAVDKLLEENKLPEARALDAKSRNGCGYDFNKIVAAGPLDGQEYAYKCPKCGVEGVYGAPLFYAEEVK